MEFINLQSPIIYFLLDKDEVVYVGQSKVGMCRPYQHLEIKFDKISVMVCKEKELDFLESKYIIKYKPRYNKSVPNNFSYSYNNAVKMIRKNTLLSDFSLWDLKRMVRKLKISTDVFNGISYIRKNDFEKILEFLKDNKIKDCYELKGLSL